MTTPRLHHRLQVLVDEAGNPLQASVDTAHVQTGEVVSITTWTPGPFETAAEVLEQALRVAQDRTGVQLTLPW